MKTTKLHLFVLFFTLTLTTVFSQPGYFGSLYNISVYAQPKFSQRLFKLFPWAESSGYFTQIELQDTTSATYRISPVVGSIRYQISASRVLSSNFQIGLSYAYSSYNNIIMYAQRDNYSLYGFSNIYYVIQANKVKLQETKIGVNGKLFFSGLAPLGGFFGFSLNMGAVSSQTDSITFKSTNDYFGTIAYDGRNSKYIVNFLGTDTIVPLKDIKVNFFEINIDYGNVIPLNKKLAFEYSVIIPLIRNYSNAQRTYLPADKNQVDIQLNEEQDIRFIFAKSSRYMEDFSISIGVKYFIGN